MAPSERALLAYVLAKIHRVDPDLLVVCQMATDCLPPMGGVVLIAGPQPDSLPLGCVAEQTGCLQGASLVQSQQTEET